MRNNFPQHVNFIAEVEVKINRKEGAIIGVELTSRAAPINFGLDDGKCEAETGGSESVLYILKLEYSVLVSENVMSKNEPHLSSTEDSKSWHAL